MSDITTTDLIQALWEDARRETEPARKAQLERDAAALEDVWERSKYALAPTREQFQAALGNTTLNIADTLASLATNQRVVNDRVGEIHEYVQQNNTLFSTFFEMFPPQFEAFQKEARAAWEESGRSQKKLTSEFHTFRIESTKRHDAADKQRDVFTRDMLAIRAQLQLLEDTDTQVKADLDAIGTADAAALLKQLVADVRTLMADKARFEAVEKVLSDLAARIGDALPTEADQDLSARLRVDEAERVEHAAV